MPDSKDKKAQLREARLAQETADEQKARRNKTRMIAAGVGVTLVVVAVIVGVLASSGDKSTEVAAAPEWADAPEPASAVAITESSESQLAAAAKKAGCELNKNRNEGSTHEDPSANFEYTANPPTSGDHTPTWAQDGAYSGADWSAPYLVHALEHGRIVYQWNPSLVSDQQLGSLKKLYDNDPYHLILSPNTTEMSDAIAATAWDRSMTCAKMNEDVFAALRQFRLNYIDQAPEQVP